MKPIKVSKDEASTIDGGNKEIHPYNFPSKDFSVARMVLKGRFPEEEDTYSLERDCSFVLSVTKGSASIVAGEETFEVSEGDVVHVPKGNKFSIEGDIEYVTFVTPAFYPDQMKILEE